MSFVKKVDKCLESIEARGISQCDRNFSLSLLINQQKVNNAATSIQLALKEQKVEVRETRVRQLVRDLIPILVSINTKRLQANSSYAEPLSPPMWDGWKDRGRGEHYESAKEEEEEEERVESAKMDDSYVLESNFSYEGPELVNLREQMAQVIQEFLIENNLGHLKGAELEQIVIAIYNAIIEMV